MWNDVIDLQSFYTGPLGQVARRLIRRRIRKIWPDLHGLRLLGVGFATPYLRPFLDEAERVLAVMPASQGVLPWPEDRGGLVTLAEESALPFADRSIDRLLLVHVLESSEQVRALMREVWRVTADGGRLLAIVPNRRGIWARLDGNPFGVGRPYTASQIDTLLRDAMFTPLRTEAALFMPPWTSRVLLTWAPAWERVGERWFQTFSGVLLIEAVKQIYAAPVSRVVEDRRRASLAFPAGGRR